MIKSNLFICLALSVFLMGCSGGKSGNDTANCVLAEEYVYSFSMESVGNYRVAVQIKSDSTYLIDQQNYFFDRQAGTNTPKNIDGVLTQDEFERFDKLVRESDLFSMDDSYGFDDSFEGSMMYMIELRSGENLKYVSINPEIPQRFSDEFNNLLRFTIKFMNSKLVD